MQCENCRAELSPDSKVCPECGELVLQNVEGFDNTGEMAKRLRKIIDEYGKSVVIDDLRFIALLKDFAPELEKERGLIKNMIEAGVLRGMVREKTGEMAVMKAKNFMLHKLFISENAAEFVIVCFTYMLSFPYLSPLRRKAPEEVKKEEEQEQEKQRFVAANIEERVFAPMDALRFRLARNVVIPDGYTKVDSFCFDKFNFMHTVKLPSSVLAIGDYAFSECKNLKSIDLPDSLRIIKQGAFSQCAKLTLINIPKGVLEIEDNTFSFCSSLEVVEIPSTVGSIGASAFASCDKLRRLFLPASIKYIDDEAFLYCPELTVRCYENTYVHRFCITNGIKAETVREGTDLRAKNI